MPDRETWRFVNSFAPWLSAIGTLIAVAVSLYLARRADRPRVRVHTAIARIVVEGQTPAQGVRVLDISVTNHGGRPITVQGLAWRTGLLRKRHYVQIGPNNRHSARLPAKLDYGDKVAFVFPLDGLPADDRLVAQAVARAYLPALAVRFVCAGVVLTTGQSVLSRVHRNVQEWLREQALKQGAPPAGG
jgi:hypothetical protein